MEIEVREDKVQEIYAELKDVFDGRKLSLNEVRLILFQLYDDISRVYREG